MNFSYIHENKILASLHKLALAPSRKHFLNEEILSRMEERLSLIKLQPEKILNLECLESDAEKRLKQQYPKAEIITLNLASILKTTSYNFPLELASMDMIFSSLTLHYCDDLAGVFQTLSQLLKPEGLFFFTLYGPDTLKELRDAWYSVNDDAHVQPFFDMHDVGDLLLKVNLTEPVMDMELITLKYKSVQSFIKELKKQVPTNYLMGNPKGFTSKNQWNAMENNYEQWRDKEGYLPVTCEIIYGHAWGKGFTLKQEKNENGETIVPIHKIPRRF